MYTITLWYYTINYYNYTIIIIIIIIILLLVYHNYYGIPYYVLTSSRKSGGKCMGSVALHACMTIVCLLIYLHDHDVSAIIIYLNPHVWIDQR